MKTKLLIVLLVLTSMFAQAKEVRTFDKLRQGDSFTLKVTVSDGVVGHNSIWDFDQAQKLEVQFDVLSVDKDSVRFGIKPTNWFAHFQDKDQHDPNPYSLFKVYNYYDSYFFSRYANGESIFYLFRDNNVILSASIKDGRVSTNFLPIPEESGIFTRDRKRWYSDLLQITTGVKIIGGGGIPKDLTLDFEAVLRTAAQGFFHNWIEKSRKGNLMPWFVDLRDPVTTQNTQTPTFVQIVSASFDLQPNVRLIYTPSKDIPEDRVFITNNGERIRPAKKSSDGSYTFEFFLSSPKRMKINGILLDLTPDDSIKIEYNTVENDYLFTGRGSANSAYTNQIVKFYKEEKELQNSGELWKITQQQIDDFFDKGKAKHQTLLQTYGKEMNAYWIRSAELSYNYWYLSEKVNMHNAITQQNIGDFMKPMPLQYQIDWTSKEFGCIFPASDYLYQPYTYGKFLDSYYSYKAWQTNDDVLTGMRYLQEHIPKYYFADAIFWGYPRFYLTSETLKYLMTGFHLEDSQREYDDFLRKCAEPGLRTSITSMHEQVEKVEPGANIKDLNLAIQNYIPLKNASDSYIVLLVDEGLTESFNLQLKNPYKESDKENDYLRDKITPCVITSASRKSLFEKNNNAQEYITFVSDDKLRDYYDKVITRKGCYIIMRSDGTILDRVLGNYNDSGILILSVIEEDIQKQKNQSTASGGILVPIILSSLFSVILTFFIVRLVIQRRERTKRHISELELKAIRAQMNPHFTFNALGSIQNLINQKKDKEANDYLVNFAKLLRLVLSTSEKRLITLSEEIEQLELYLRLEQLRVPFRYTIDIDESIDVENEEIPGMLIQPIVENAVKHGVVPKGGGHIKLTFTMTGQVLYVTVTDTGNGYVVPEDTTKTGFGLQAIRERLKLLNKELKLEIGLQIENIETDRKITGCMVTISIPV